MKKWLVGLMAAGLCATSAWATDDVLTRETTGVEGTNYKDWTATGASGAAYAGNSAGGNDSIQLRSDKNSSGIVMTKSAGSDVASVTVAWNDATAAGRTNLIYGSTTAYTSPADLYGDNKGTLLGEIARNATTLAVPAGYPYIGIRSKNGAEYLTSVTIGFAGASGPSVTLSASATEVEVGDELTITATATGFSGDVDWTWTGKGTANEETFAVDTSAVDEFEVTATATYGAETATDSITIKVNPVTVKYNVITPVGGNGFIVATPDKAAEDDDVTLTATPNSGYKFVEMSVTGVDSGDAIATFTTSTGSFKMPAEDVRVGATFEEVEGVAFELVASDADFAPGADYIIVATGNGYTNAMSNVATNDRISVANVSIADKTVLVESDDIVWTIAAASNNKYTLYNADAAKFVAAPTSASDNKAFLVATGTADEAQWTISVATNSLVTIGSVHEGKSLLRNSTAANAYFANYKSGAKTYLYKKAGASVPTVTYTGDTTVTLPDGEFSIQFSLKGYEGAVTWVKDGREGGSIDEATGLYTWKPTEANDEINITVRAVDGESVIASTDVTLVVREAPKSYTVEVADGILNGTVKISVGGEIVDDPATVLEGTKVTLIAEPVDGSYKLGSISVKTEAGGDVELASDNSFTMPPDNVTVYAEFVEKPVVSGDVLTNEDVGHQSNSYKDWTATKDSGAEYAGQSAGGSTNNPCIQLRSTNPSGIVMTKGSGQNVASVSIEWNAQSSTGRVVEVYGSATAYATPADLYDDAKKGTLLGSVTYDGETMTADVVVSGDYPFIGIRSKSGALYLASVTIAFGGEAKPSISGTVESEMLLGGTANATFTLSGATATGWTASLGSIADGVWSWTPDEAGTFTLTVTATYDGGSAEASFPIEVTDPAAFDRYTKVTSIDDLEDGEYLVVGANADKFFAMTAGLSSGVALGTEVEVKTDEEVPYVLWNDASIVWSVTYDESTGMTISSTKDKYLGYDSSKADNKLWSFDTISDASTWTVSFSEENVLFTLTSKVQDKDGVDRCLRFNYNGGSTRFAGYKASSTMKDVALFKKGAAGPSVSLSASAAEVEIGEALTITATAKNFSGDVAWAWEGDDGGSADGAVYTVNTSAEGTFTVKATATVGEETASKEITVTVKKGEEPPPPAGTLTCDPSSVTMAVGGSARVTVTLEGAELDGGYIYFEDYPDVYSLESTAEFDLAELELAEGEYSLKLLAVDAGMNELASTTLSVTVTGEGPQPGGEMSIEDLTFDSDAKELKFKKPDGPYTVKSTTSLTDAWSATEGVREEGDWVIVPMTGDRGFVRIGDPQ